MKGLFAIALLVLMLAFMPNEKKRDKTPPGTVRINDTLFMDETEVANVHWREFLYWLEMIEKDSAAAKQNLPDTLAWNERPVMYGEPYVLYYFRHPSYDNYPVVTISYEQATKYCKWRSSRVNELYEKSPKQNPFPNKKYRYRLPSKTEWEMVASGKLDIEVFPFGHESIYNKKYKTSNDKLGIIANSSEKETFSGQHSMYRFTLPSITSAFIKNGYGCYNMIGNVSEMVAEKGIAKGGNFLLPLDSCRIKLEQHYTKPAAWLGFRCVCVVE